MTASIAIRSGYAARTLRPGAPLDWVVTGEATGAVDALVLTDMLGDGQAWDPARPPDVTLTLGGTTLFSGAVAPAAQRDAATGVTRLTLDVASALRGAGLAGTVPDGAVVQVAVHGAIGTEYAATRQPLLSRRIGQGDPLDNAARFTGLASGQAVASGVSRAQAVLPVSTLAASVYAVSGDQVTYRLRLAMPLGTAQGVQVSGASPGLPGTVAWDGAAAGLPALGHAGFGPDSPAGLHPPLVGTTTGPAGTAILFDFGDLASTGAAPAVLDLLYTAQVPAGVGAAVQGMGTEVNSYGIVSGTAAAADLAAGAPDLRLQTGSLDATGPQSFFEVVGTGSGSPVAYSTYTGQFSGPVTSADLDADPFSDRLRDVAAGDQVTFVIAVQNKGAAAAWDVVLRDTLPAGFIVPAGGADLHVTNGAGYDIATTGDLFSPTDGLHLGPGAPLAAYNASSGLNVALVTFTLQATSAIPAPSATLRNAARVVHAAASSGGADLSAAGGPGLAGVTEVVTMAPTVSIGLTGTSAASTPGNLLALGEAATFHAAVTLPSGRSTGVRIDAAVPAGLSVVSETITYATPGTTGLYVGEASASGFNLGTLSAAAPIRVELDIVARATGASSGAVQAVVSAADPGGTAARAATAAGAPVVATVPALSLAVEGPVQVQAGQVAAYTLRLTNAAGAAPAYGVRLADALGAGLTLVPGSVTASGPAAGAVASMGAAGPVADVTRLDAGETLVLTVQAKAGAAAPGARLATTAQATASALPGGAAASQVAPVAAAATATVVAATAAVSLSSPAARVGDTVTIQIVAALPQGGNPAVRIDTTFADGLAVVPGSVRLLGGGPAAVTLGGGRVGIDLGPITAPAGGGQAVVEMQAVVGAVPVGAGLSASAVVSTGYSAGPAGTASVQVVNTSPALAGTVPLVAAADASGVVPFGGLVLTDPDPGQAEAARVTLSNPASGTLATPGAGSYDPATGVYAVTGSAAAVQDALRGLRFVPAHGQALVGALVETDLAVQVSDGAGSASATTHATANGSNRPPAIAGGLAGQATTTTLGVLPFTGLHLSDPDAGGTGTLTIHAQPGLGALRGGLGAYDAAAGTYTARGTLDALTVDARGLVFTPSAPGMATFAVTLDDGAGGIAQDSTTTLQVQPSADTSGVAQHFLQLPGATFLTAAGGHFTTLVGEEYHGPVTYLANQFIYDSADPAVIFAGATSSFVKSLSGFCAIQLAGGRNVVDAGPGSNFITGGDGDDTFFLDGTHGAVTWNTIQNFHPGDMMTLFGFHPGTSSFVWADGEGASGYTGRTIHADLAGDGTITANLTFAGTTAADTDRYIVQTGSLGTLDYLAVTYLR